MNAPPRQRLELVECARGLAAFSVLLFHANATSQLEGWRNFPWFTVFQYGVDFFFVLSGYIIYFAHSGDLGRRETIRPYLRKRAIRLLPTLWLVTTGVFVLRLAADLPVDFAQFARSAVPYPSLLSTAPPVVWTLRHEFIFYAAFALAIFSRRLGLAFFAVWALACIAQLVLMLSGMQMRGLASFFLSSYSLDFMIGMGIARLHQSRIFKPSLLPLVVGFVILGASLFLDLGIGFHRVGPTDYVTTQAGWFTLALGISFGIILHGLVVLEGHVRAPSALVALGGATYALYLVHTPVNGLTLIALKHLGIADEFAGGAGAVLLIVLGTIAGLALHRGFERPVGKWLRRAPQEGSPALPSPPAQSATPS